MDIGSRLSGFLGLSSPVNKVKEGDVKDTQEGTIGPLLPELELTMSDEELLKLTKQWKDSWSQWSVNWLNDCLDVEKYWLGQQYAELGEERPLQDNILFESLETFLAIVTRKNPEPNVTDPLNTEEGKDFALKVSRNLAYLSDLRRLKLKLKKMARYWSLYRLGVIKIVWDLAENEIDFIPIRPQKLILDPNATINECEYSGDYIGEYRKDTANTLIRRYPNKETFIKSQVQGKLDTQLQYIEWWTDEYTCWELNGEILDKIKNPHYNYETNETTTDEFGLDMENEVPGNNHFVLPQKPYVFLSVFNLGKHPVDDTSLLKQNLATQDLINKRLKQIDRNADNINGGWAISGALSGILKGQAAEAVEAFREGGAVWIPQGDVNRAVAKMVGSPLPTEVYNQLVDARNEVRNNMGVRGSNPQGTMSEKTVRGKIITSGQDADRSSLIAEYLEQVADQIFNWATQMMAVYYDTPHQTPMADNKPEMSNEVSKTDFVHKILVSVKEGSLIPKDPLTVRNEAIDLWSAGALDPISLYKALDFPNPDDMAMKLFQWKTNPQGLFQNQPGMNPPMAGVPGVEPSPMGGPNSLNQQQLSAEQPQDILSKVPIQNV